MLEQFRSGLKTVLRIVRYILVSILTVVLAYFIIALLLSFIPSQPASSEEKKDQTIYISSNGVHLDIILANEKLGRVLYSNLNATTYGYTSFGWGDRDFFLNTPEWKDLSFKTAYKALFCTSETLIHIDRFSRKSKTWKSIKISNKSLTRLTTYLENSFVKDSLNHFIEVPDAHYNSTDSFYEATGSYSCFKTCNTWINMALKESNCTTSLWTPFDFGVMYHIQNQ